MRGPDEPKRPPADKALILDLELARVRLAGARFAADARAGAGVRADRLRAGSELAAGGLAVQVVSVKPTPSGVRVVLGIGDARLILEAAPGPCSRFVASSRRCVRAVRRKTSRWP